MKGVEFKLNLKDGKGLVKSDKETSIVLGNLLKSFRKKGMDPALRKPTA